MQQKAIHIENKTVIESDLLPSAVECYVKDINLKTQLVELVGMHYIEHSPSNQKYIRVMPEKESNMEIYLNEHKINADLYIMDISLGGCSIVLKSLPPEIKENSDVFLKIQLGKYQNHIILNIDAKITKIDRRNGDVGVVITFDLKGEDKKLLVDYITKRLMALIREFKGLLNG